MIMMFIVQVSQLMIGTIVVHYAAFAAARTAIVWIPARLGLEESENCISVYDLDPRPTTRRCRYWTPTARSTGPARAA